MVLRHDVGCASQDDFLQFASKLPTGSNGVTVPRLCDFFFESIGDGSIATKESDVFCWFRFILIPELN